MGNGHVSVTPEKIAYIGFIECEVLENSQNLIGAD